MQRLHWSAFACLLCAGTLVTARTLSSDEASDVELNALQQKARHLLQTDAAPSPAPAEQASPSVSVSSPSSSTPATNSSSSSASAAASASSSSNTTSSRNTTSAQAPAPAAASTAPAAASTAPTAPAAASTAPTAPAAAGPTAAGPTAAGPTAAGPTAAAPAAAASAANSSSNTTKPAGIQSAATYTAAGAGSGATIVYAGATSASSTPPVTARVGATPSTPATSSATAQTNVESGYGGPDYAGAYAHNFTASDVTVTPTTGSSGSSTVTTSTAASTVVAFDTVLNTAVVYGNMTAVNTSSSRTIASGTGSFAEAGLSGAIAIHAIYTLDETVLFFERPHVGAANSGVTPNPYLSNGNGETEIASIYNIGSQTFTPFHFDTNAFCAGHSAAQDGSAVIAGGDNVNLVPGFLENGLYAVRTFDSGSLATPVPDMGVARWYPTTCTLQDGTTLIAGGSTAEGGGYGSDSALNEPTYQIFSGGAVTAPASLPILSRTFPVNLYPYIAVLPVTGSLLVIAGAETDIYNGANGRAFTGLDSRYPAVPDLPVPVSYPQTATFALLSLEPVNDYAPEVVVFGGSSTDQANAQTPASSSSYRINLGAETLAWETESMPFPRVMGDAVLLPDGTVFVTNGGQVGIAGGVPLAAAASDGITTPVLYNPYNDAGSRYTELADSQIQRLYHSNAFLLTSGQVLVAGSEATLDYRVQIYTPAYLQTGTARPVMSGAPGQVAYGASFAVHFSGTTSIDRVTMIRQNAVTHSIHMDERQVALSITSVSAGTVTVTAPPDATIAPPGYYMLFLMYTGVPSVASWVHVG